MLKQIQTQDSHLRVFAGVLCWQGFQSLYLLHDRSLNNFQKLFTTPLFPNDIYEKEIQNASTIISNELICNEK